MALPASTAAAHPFAAANATLLRQTLTVVGMLDDEGYVQALPPALASGVGAHVRHIADHYRCFLAGLRTGRIDYDDRERDPAVEASPAAGRARLEELAEVVGQIAEGEGATVLLVRMACGAGEGDDAGWARSSVARELQFLVSHTVHHQALIGALVRLRGGTVAPDFGLAPSTIRFRAAQR